MFLIDIPKKLKELQEKYYKLTEELNNCKKDIAVKDYQLKELHNCIKNMEKLITRPQDYFNTGQVFINSNIVLSDSSKINNDK
jgi:chaperonin cofactor prefoldin